jgi:hypothetical protein
MLVSVEAVKRAVGGGELVGQIARVRSTFRHVAMVLRLRREMWTGAGELCFGVAIARHMDVDRIPPGESPCRPKVISTL